MAASGAVYKDLLPVPHETEPEKKEISTSLGDKPTDSHALALEDHEEKGAAQVFHTEEVVDLGWNEPGSKIESPLVGGLANEDLWVLIRRFNKVWIFFFGPKDYADAWF